jgi:hypothetical protein
MAAIDVPSGDWSIAMTRACLEITPPLLVELEPTVRRDDVADVDRDGVDLTDFLLGFLTRLGIGISSVCHGMCRTTEAPSRPSSRRGRIPESARRPERPQ